MPSLVDIFNPSFFVFLGILVLVAALLVVYFESKMREQNHKMSSMLALITCVTDEMNVIKIHLNNQPNIGGAPINPSGLETNDVHIIKTKLIDVSDDSDSESDSESDNDDSESNSEDIDIEEDIEEDIEDIEDIKEIKEIIEIGGEHNDIKVFKLNISNINNIDENILDNNIDDLCAEENDVSDDDISISSSDDEIEEKNKNEIDISSLNLKSINISNLEEIKNSDFIDYRKFTLSKLRSVVVEKELVVDSSKLKKNELLKLLGIE
jgi:hypothetical protein